jgi:hypothetical protein
MTPLTTELSWVNYICLAWRLVTARLNDVSTKEYSREARGMLTGS